MIYSSLPNNSYGFAEGTSMAAPHVTGAWAILKQLRPSGSTTMILDALRATGHAVADAASATSYPRIDVRAAAAALAPPVPPSAPRSLSASVSGATITVTWQPPATGAATQYVIEAGSSPGAANFYNGPVGAVLSVSAPVPPGTYYIRGRAQNASGTSAVSNEAVITVSSTGGVAPGAPQGLTASVSASTISIAWVAPSGGGAVTSHVVEAGSGPGLANLYAGAAPASPTSLSASAPAGTYYIRVRARNDAGVSGPSNEVVATVGASCSVPSAPVLTGSRSGNTATVSWTTPSGGPVTTYVLQAGSSTGASNLYNASVGMMTTLSATVSPGTYFVRVIAHSGCGPSGASNEVVITVP